MIVGHDHGSRLKVTGGRCSFSAESERAKLGKPGPAVWKKGKIDLNWKLLKMVGATSSDDFSSCVRVPPLRGSDADEKRASIVCIVGLSLSLHGILFLNEAVLNSRVLKRLPSILHA